MIRRGRNEGWLRRSPSTTLKPWAELNYSTFNGIRIGPLTGHESKGSAVIAEQALPRDTDLPLMTIPKELILSLETIETHAKSDRYLREVLAALGEFGRTARGAILVFMLVQATISCPHVPEITGVQNPLTEYIKFLPDEFLPTFWNEEEQEALTGTSLRPAVRAKLKSLRREFNELRAATAEISWCSKYWWNDVDGLLSFDDWMQVDAMYRSRALEYPKIGDCMVPCIDMANHASGAATVALYEADEDGNAILVLREGKKVEAGGEVTITYGDEKGACEMLFSYGFLENSMESAKVIFLDLDMPADDPLREPKLFVSNSAPGFRIFERGTKISWESDFVWLICVNEEDGMGFNVLQTTDGGRELGALWKDQDLQDTTKLKDLLQVEALWDVYQLRAVSLLQDRVEEQLHLLQEQGEKDASDQGVNSAVREEPRRQAMRLRALELALLEQAYGDLEDQKAALAASETVRRYLGVSQSGAGEGIEEDFS